MSKIGKRIEQLLDERDISQRDLAEGADITEVSISRYVSGARTPSLENAAKIAKFFNVTIEYLIGENEPAPEDISVADAVKRLNFLIQSSIFEKHSYIDQALRKAVEVMEKLPVPEEV